MPKINREVSAKPTINGESWWLVIPRPEFQAFARQLFNVEEPPTALGVSWQQMAKWDQKRKAS